jgi:hypothetical protein
MLPICWSKNFERILYDTSFEWKWHMEDWDMIFVVLTVHLLFIFVWPVHRVPWSLNCAGIFKQSLGAGNRVVIGLSFRPGRLHRLAELISWNRFLGYLKNCTNSGSEGGGWQSIKTTSKVVYVLYVGPEVNLKKNDFLPALTWWNQDSGGGGGGL